MLDSYSLSLDSLDTRKSVLRSSSVLFVNFPRLIIGSSLGGSSALARLNEEEGALGSPSPSPRPRASRAARKQTTVKTNTWMGIDLLRDERDIKPSDSSSSLGSSVDMVFVASF